MKKNQIATAPIIDAHNENSKGLVLKELIGKSTVGSHRGLLALATFSVNGSQNLYRLANANHVAYLLSGEADYLTETGPVALGPGDTVYAPKGDWHGFRNKGSQEAVFIFMYSPVSDYGALSYEAYQGILPQASAQIPSIRRARLSEMQGDAALNEDAGFIGLGVYWLAVAETVGTTDFLLGASTFEPGGLHEHHRHPNGDEFLFILEGGGAHLTPHGSVPLGAGEIAFIPANEYHGYQNREGVLTKTLFGYFGPANLEQAGYEVREPAE